MKKELLLIIILTVIIAVLLGVLIWLPKPAQNNEQDSEGLQIIFPKENAEISSPVKITGVANGGGWNGFEGQVGTVKLLDKNGNQIGEISILTATTDWMQPKVSFEATLNFVSSENQNGTLVFKNENPSGEPARDKTFSLPVKIVKTGETMVLKVFFNNSKLDPEASCNKVFAVERVVPKTESTGTAALQELFSSPTQAEKDAGYFTSINSGVKLQSLMIGMDSGTAWADFNQQLQEGVGGSCRVSAIRAQITQTLLQFPTIKSVVISINGRTEDILQP